MHRSPPAHAGATRATVIGRFLGPALAALVLCATTGSTLASSLPPAGFADSARVEIERAQVRGDLPALVEVRARLERATAASPDDAWLAHYLGYAMYREAMLRRHRDREPGERLLKAAQAILERSAKLDPRPETAALIASAIGQQIGKSPFRGMRLGPRSDRWMEEALSLGPDNPRVWLMRGQSAIFTPRPFGGGLDKAERHLRRAIELYPRDAPEPPAPAWGREEAWIWLGEVHRRAGRLDEARVAYQQALAIEPEHQWVRMSLLPGLERVARARR